MVALLVACGSVDGARQASPEVTDSTQDASQAQLSILGMDEATGMLKLHFEKDGRGITYDLRLGPKMSYPPEASELAANAELPIYEVDAQVLDGAGQPFELQIGGDSLLDSSWSFPVVQGFDEAGRLRDIQLMRAAVPALRALRLPIGLEQLRLSAIQLGLGVETRAEKQEDATAVTVPSGSVKVQAIESGLTSGTSSVVKWDYRIRVHDLFGGAGEHSSVNLRGWSASTSVVFNANSCNHGSCANNSNNSTKCTMSGFLRDDGTHTRFFYIERSSNTTVSGGCTTIEEWDSTNALHGSHNCNDDSELQVKAIHADSAQCRDCGSCHSFGLHNFAPDCR